MADYKTTDAELTSIANAIRSKSGVSNQLEYPTEYVSTILGISGGVNIPVLLSVTTPPTKTEYSVNDQLDLTGIVVTATYANGNTENVTSQCTFSPANGTVLSNIGTETISISYSTSDTTSGHNYSISLSASQSVSVSDSATVEIVPWSSGTDAQIAAMIAALDSGKITIADTGWNIGDERVCSLSAMEATGVGESHAAQNVTLVLMDSQHFDLVGGGKDHFVVGLKDSLNETGYMNSSRTNAGSWKDSARRAWCNSVFKNSFPETIKNCFKPFYCITASAYSGTSLDTTEDTFALFAAKEIKESPDGHTNGTENSTLGHIQWYDSNDKMNKKSGANLYNWWLRSPAGSDYQYESFGSVYNYSIKTSIAINDFGIAPFGCI